MYFYIIIYIEIQIEYLIYEKLEKRVCEEKFGNKIINVLNSFYDKIKNHRRLFFMERKRRKGINVTEGKRNIITALINEYDIKTAEDIQDALKDLLGGTIQEMFEAE